MCRDRVTRRDAIKITGLAGLSAGALSLAGCLGGFGGSDAESLDIGGIVALSGPFAPWGSSSLAGAELAASEINESGELDWDINILSRDTESSPGDAASAFDSFENQDVSAVFGTTQGDVILRVRQQAEQAEIPHFTNTPGFRQTFGRGTRYTFRMNMGPIWNIMQAQAEIIQENNFQRVGAVIADYSWGHANIRAIEEFIQPLDGVETQIEVAPVQPSDYNSIVRRFSDFDPDVMLTGGHPPGAASVAGTQFELGMNPAITLGVALHAQIWANVLGDAVFNNIVEWSPFNPTNQEYLDFAQRYYEENEEYADQYTAVGYNVVNLIAEAARQSGSVDPVTIADTVRNMSFDTFFAYPIEYTETGELAESRVVFTEFASGEPPNGINPGANWHLEEYATSSSYSAPPVVDPPS